MSNTHNGIFLSNADGTLKEYANNSGGRSDVDTSTLANKTDISSLSLSGTTNTSGGTISAGTWFYLNGELVRAKVDIANNATFTLNTNYEEKTVGSALSELNSNSLTFTIDSSDYGQDLVGYVKNGIGFITGSTKPQPPNTWVKVGQITDRTYWPRATISTVSKDAGILYFGAAYIDTSGIIYSYHTIANSNLYMNFDLIYAVN